MDQEALERATSVYLVDRVVPMLPEALCNNLCSLRPNEDKLCFSAIFELDQNAQIQNEWFGKTIINSNRRFCYEEAQEIIETGKGDYAQEILKCWDLAKILLNINAISPILANRGICAIFRCPYHANVINVLLHKSSKMV